MYNCLTAIIDLGSLSMTPSKYPAINLGAVNIVNISANTLPQSKTTNSQSLTMKRALIALELVGDNLTDAVKYMGPVAPMARDM
jgi:hypothetical protein